MGTVSRQKVFLTSENHSEGKWLEPDLGNDLWNAALFPDLKVTQSSDDALPLFQNSDDVKNTWEDTPARQKSSRLPIFHELTRRGLSDEVPDESYPSTSSSSSGSSKGWEGFCDDSSFSKVESRLAAEFSNSLEIGSPKETPKPKDKKPRQMDIFRKKELTPKQWDHLRYTNEELCADVNFMEGVFVRLADVKQPPSTKERLIILKQLSRIVTPTNSLRLCVTTHSRRQVMLALEFILKERSLRQHVYAVLCKMFEDLDLLVELDMKELIFAGKAHVFHDTIAFCDMKQVITLANCLLKTSWAGIGSTLGMGLIGRLIGRANSLDFKSEPAWLEDCLPGLAFNVLQVKDLKAVFRILGIVSVRHLLENLSKDHEMFKGPEF